MKKELRIPDEKLNVNGGAIAFGDPVGVSGCRIPVALIYAMRQKTKYGLSILCIGSSIECNTIIKMD